MDGIDVTCPECGKRFVAPASLAGKRAKCGSCGHVLDVPSVQTEAPTKTEAEKAADRILARTTERTQSRVTLRWAMIALLCGVTALLLHSAVWPGLILGIAAVPFFAVHLKQVPRGSETRLYVSGLIAGTAGLITGLIAIALAVMVPLRAGQAPTHAGPAAQVAQQDAAPAEAARPVEPPQSSPAPPSRPPTPAAAEPSESAAVVAPHRPRSRSATIMEPEQLTLLPRRETPGGPTAGFAVRPKAQGPQEAAPAPAKTRDEIIQEIKESYQADVARLQAKEQERYHQQYQELQSKYVYPDKFSAVMRQMDGQQLTYDIWHSVGVRYPGAGSAADALQNLKSYRTEVPGWESRVASLRNEVAQLREEYGRRRVELKNRIVRRAVGGSPERGFTGFGYPASSSHESLKELSQYYQERIDPLEREIFSLQQRITDAYRRLQHWEQQETLYRSQESLQVRALAGQRDARIKEGLQALWENPRYAFIYQYIELENKIYQRRETIQTKRNVIDMLRESGAEERTADVREEIAAEQERAEKFERQLDELVESYFQDRAM